MANRRPLSYPRFQAWDDDETFLNGGTVTFYEAGSTNKRDIFQDAALSVKAPNPVTLNSRGEPEANDGTPIDIYVDENPIKIVLKDADGGTVHTIDNYIYNGSDVTPQFVALDLGDDGNDESSGLDRISIVNDTNGIATESVADELNFDMSKNWPTADDVPDSAIDHDQTTNFVANEHVDHTTVNITAGTGLAGGGDISATRTLSVDEANVDHDSLLNFVVNEHIDHSGVNITAGTGLSGGGNITATRTLNLDINPLTTVTLSGSDEVAVGDVSDTNNIKKVTAQDIADLGASSATALPQDPENATDGGVDDYASETTTSTPAAGIVRSRDFQSANTTTTPTLDGITLVAKDGSALWVGAINGLHLIKYDGTNYRVTNAQSIDEDDMASDSDTAVPTQQSVAAFVGAEKISTGALSGATVTISLPSGYSAFVLVINDLQPETDSTGFLFRTSADGGSTFDSGASDYENQEFQVDGTNVAAARGTNDHGKLASPFSNNTNETSAGTVMIHDTGNSGSRTFIASDFALVADDGPIRMQQNKVQRLSLQTVEAIRVFFSNGNISQGNYTLYGMR